MPRLSPSIFKQAYSKSELLPLILRGARTLDSSINELRWLKEHVQTLKPSSPETARLKLLNLCQRRSKGEPLQYILGSQPFGELDIKCRPGVLIPRPETELYTTYLASLINAPPTSNEIPNLYSKRANPKTSPPSLRILDLCSGSGCISLLLHSLLSPRFPQLQIFGLDISTKAVALSKKNLSHNVLSGYLSSSASKDRPNRPPQVQFGIADVLADLAENLGQFDVIISNPPYISRPHFSTQTTRSVRKYEPLLALVPRDENPDIFYERLIRLHQIHLSNVTVMEVGDAAQAVRVVELAGEMDYQGFRKAPRVRNRLEIWRDDPGLQDPDRDQEIRNIAGREVLFRGCGKIRAVVLFREKTDRHSVHKTLLNSNVVERLGVPPGEIPLTKQKLRRQLNKERQKRKTIRRNQARKTKEMKEERARASQIWKRDAEVLRMKIREILMKKKSGAFEERS